MKCEIWKKEFQPEINKQSRKEEIVLKSPPTVFTGTMFKKETAAEPLIELKPECPYFVKINTDQLNCRRSAGTIYGVIGAVFKNEIHEIIEEAAGKGASKWGKLKNNRGWISLDFCVLVK